MRKRSIHRNFMIAMGALSIFLVLIWVLFFLMTNRVLQNNLTAQAEAASDSIMLSMERELSALENTAYALGRYDRIGDMIAAEQTGEFYDLGGIAAARSELLTEDNSTADNVVVIRSDGLFYRLRGRMGNTAVKRAAFLINEGNERLITLSSNNTTYIGVVEKVIENCSLDGYVCLLTEKTRLENLFNTFSDMDYLGITLMVADKVICSNKSDDAGEVEKALESALFFKRRDIGFTGLSLIVYCDNSVPDKVGRYFALALPVMAVILLAAMAIAAERMNRHIVRPINSIITNVTEMSDDPLPKTGETYFDDLVDHVNAMLASIKTRDRELLDSRLKIKDSEIQAEKTLISLLKKQISAHFTVNTLNAVRALINKDEKEKAAEICNELSELLRYANAGEDKISLMEEFHVLEQYASIMRKRYPDMFEFEAVNDDSFADVFIPRMLLQPIVENAILHGLANKQGSVSVTAEIRGNDVVIKIYDNGKGMSPSELAEVRDRLANPDKYRDTDLSHVALINVQRRIKLVCGEKYGVETESGETFGTCVTVILPADNVWTVKRA
jgi:sensor histidine kinase YesM